MSFGNNIGVKLNEELDLTTLKIKNYGNIILEVNDEKDVKLENKRVLGTTINENKIIYKNEEVSLEEAYKTYSEVLDDVYPLTSHNEKTIIEPKDCDIRPVLHAKKHYDGVCVVPKEIEEEVFTRALEKARGERVVLKKIQEGMSASDAFAKYGIM